MDKDFLRHLRLFFAVLLIVGLLGITVCDFKRGDFKTAILGMLFAIGNIIIFFF